MSQNYRLAPATATGEVLRTGKPQGKAGKSAQTGSAILDWVMRTRQIMAMNENLFDVHSDEREEKRRPLKGTLHPLHEAAMRIADIGLGRSRNRTKDLVGALLAHGARARRSGQPTAGLHLHVGVSERRHPVRLRLR
jgi:hypothetical protein